MVEFHAVTLILDRPIYTHNGQGAKKHNLLESEVKQHFIIYDNRNDPTCDEEEIRRGMSSIIAIPVQMVGEQTLSEWSRVRLDSICTIRYNWKVLNIGLVTRADVLLNKLRDSLFPSSIGS